MYGLLLTASALQPYYDTISQIRKTFDMKHKKLSKYVSGFGACPKPNQFYYRTPRHLFLQKITEIDPYISSTNPIITDLRLFTPFGLVDMKYGTLGPDTHEIATDFLDHMDWDIVDVTDQFKICNTGDSKTHLMGRSEKHDTKYTIHLVTRVGSTQLVPKTTDINTLDLLFYDKIGGDKYKEVEQLFKTVSDGKCCF